MPSNQNVTALCLVALSLSACSPMVSVHENSLRNYAQDETNCMNMAKQYGALSPGITSECMRKLGWKRVKESEVASVPAGQLKVDWLAEPTYRGAIVRIAMNGKQVKKVAIDYITYAKQEVSIMHDNMKYELKCQLLKDTSVPCVITQADKIVSTHVLNM